ESKGAETKVGEIFSKLVAGGPRVLPPGGAEFVLSFPTPPAPTFPIPPPPVDTRRGFADYGLDSLQMVELSAQLEKLVHRRLSEVIAWDYPTIETLARHLSGGEQPPAPSPVDLGAADML